MEKASPRGEAFAAVWLRMDGSVTVEEIEQGFLDGPLKDAGKRCGGDAAPYSAVLLSTNARFRSTGPSTPESIPSFAYCHTSK